MMKPSSAAPAFHHVAIRTSNFDRTVKFYTEGLGFRVHHEFAVPGRIDRAAFLDAGDGRYIEIFGQGSNVQSEGRRRLPNEERTEGALLHFCLRVTDTEAAYAKALAADRARTLIYVPSSARTPWWKSALPSSPVPMARSSNSCKAIRSRQPSPLFGALIQINAHGPERDQTRCTLKGPLGKKPPAFRRPHRAYG